MVILFLPSCIINEVEEINDSYQKELSSKSMRNNSYDININIINNAKNITLTFNEIKIIGKENYKDSINNNCVINYLETINISSFKEKLQKSQVISKVILNGNVKTDSYTIYEGNIIIPINKTITKENNIIYLMLYNGCPWYTEDGYGILQSITFNVTVDEWSEENINI